MFSYNVIYIMKKSAQLPYIYITFFICSSKCSYHLQLQYFDDMKIILTLQMQVLYIKTNCALT